mgnify:CR=1 FL=1
MKNSYQMPTPDEIRRRCQEIRSGWTNSEHRVRSQPQMLSIWLPGQRRWASISNDMVMIDVVRPLARIS